MTLDLTWLISSWVVLSDLMMLSSWTRPESSLCSSWASSSCSWLSSTLLRPSSSSWLWMSDSWERIWLCSDDIWVFDAGQCFLAPSCMTHAVFKTAHSLYLKKKDVDCFRLVANSWIDRSFIKIFCMAIKPEHIYRVLSAMHHLWQSYRTLSGSLDVVFPADCGSFMAFKKKKEKYACVRPNTSVYLV